MVGVTKVENAAYTLVLNDLEARVITAVLGRMVYTDYGDTKDNDPKDRLFAYTPDEVGDAGYTVFDKLDDAIDPCQ